MKIAHYEYWNVGRALMPCIMFLWYIVQLSSSSLVGYYEPTQKKFLKGSNHTDCSDSLLQQAVLLFAPFKMLADAAKLLCWFVLAAVKCVI